MRVWSGFQRMGLAVMAAIMMPGLSDFSRVQAQVASGTIGGVVRGPAGEPIASADVLIEALRRRTRSDVRGAWRLDALPLGTHEVIIRRVGFAPMTRTVVLASAGQQVTLADTLRPRGVRLEPVVVSARRAALPGTFSRLESGASVAVFAEEIDAIRTNLYDLDALISRSSRLRAYSQFSRGEPTCRALNGSATFVDGVLTPRTIPLREWIGPYDIEAFEITRGPAALGDEARAREAGDSPGPKLDPRIASCPWVWLLWTRDYVRRRGS